MSHPSFYAEDAFTYVKTYNELIIKNLEQINDLKDDFEKKYWDGASDDHFYFIKLRAFEHALDYKINGRNPTGLVVMGKGSNESSDRQGFLDEQNKLQARIKDLERDKSEGSVNASKLEKLIHEGRNREDALHKEVLRRDKAIREIQNQKTNLIGVFVMVFAILLTTIIMLFWQRGS